MHAVTIVDGSLQWAEHPDPTPADTELLVAVRAAGINAADLLQRRGRYPAPPGVPADIPGLELAGEVVAAGRRVDRFAPGDTVMAVVAGGAQAELAVVDHTSAMAVPPGLDWAEAGGFPEVFSTAYDALFSQCGLSVGDRLLVTGAAGGVGTAAVQLAAAAGAEVIASARNPDTHAELRRLGATAALRPDEAVTAGPFDVALELVGAPSLPDVLANLRTGGRVTVIGVGAGARMELDLLSVMGRRLRISGSTLRARSLVDKALVAQAVAAHVVPLLASGAVRVPVAERFALADAAVAYERFAAGGKLGKIVLVGR
jgi:NADPH:quinone reductase-like Zn-dependent oxidoreductase